MRTPRSHTARENPSSQSTRDDLRMPVQAKLAAAWTSFMFLYIYVDFLAPLQARRHRGHPGRHVWEFDIGQTFVDHCAHAHGHPDLHGPAVDDTARPGEPHREPRRGLGLHPRLDLQRGGESWTATSTASPSDSRCCSWSSSCAPPGPGHAASTATRQRRRSRMRGRRYALVRPFSQDEVRWRRRCREAHGRRRSRRRRSGHRAGW